MKKIIVTHHKTFPETPISLWIGAKKFGWIAQKTASGQWKRPQMVPHPFAHQRKLWCALHVEFNGLEVRFAIPEELDHFLAVMTQNPLPSGHRLVPGWNLGRPNHHWLSRLPKHAKPWRFRQQLCHYLKKHKQVLEFRTFYAAQPVIFQFDGYYDSLIEAVQAQQDALKHTS